MQLQRHETRTKTRTRESRTADIRVSLCCMTITTTSVTVIRQSLERERVEVRWSDEAAVAIPTAAEWRGGDDEGQTNDPKPLKDNSPQRCASALTWL